MHAYGLDLIGPGLEHESTAGAPPHWRPTRVLQSHGRAPDRTDVRRREKDVEVLAAGAYRVRLAQDSPHGGTDTASVLTPSPLPDLALVHPVAALVGSMSAALHGHTALHGLAVSLHGRAWVLLGHQSGGKSTLAAGLDGIGVAVLADDLVVVCDGQVLRGPRSCDLRRHSAMEGGFDPSALRALSWRARWRLTLGPAPWSLPLSGFVQLEWSDEVSIAVPGVASRLSALREADALRVGAATDEQLLDLVSRPWLRLSRPRSFASVPHVRDLLETATADHADP